MGTAPRGCMRKEIFEKTHTRPAARFRHQGFGPLQVGASDTRPMGQ